VGHYFAADGEEPSLIEHWDGTSWTIQANPNPGLSRTPP